MALVESQNRLYALSKHPLLSGALPRMGLATCGGVIAGGVFDYFKQRQEEYVQKAWYMY